MVTEAPQRVLVVEDDPTVSEVVVRYLEREGLTVDTAADGNDALDRAAEHWPDLVVLDLMLPGIDGLEVCRRLRADGPVPVIMLTARGDEIDRVTGLELGADDYVVKPFSGRELIARVRAVLRRTSAVHGARTGGATSIDGLVVDPGARTAALDGDPLELTRKEFDLLALLVANAGSVVTRERLIDEVWDVNWFGSTKTLDVHVSGLRRKLGDDANEPRYLHTVRGVGFRFTAP
jgi:DNA-binding response OmpR family regulator